MVVGKLARGLRSDRVRIRQRHHDRDVGPIRYTLLDPESVIHAESKATTIRAGMSTSSAVACLERQGARNKPPTLVTALRLLRRDASCPAASMRA
jgi:hypothetical protein